MVKAKTEKWYAAMAAKRGTTARNQFTKADELGQVKPTVSERTRLILKEANRRVHSPETRKKLSLSLRKFLEENPEMVPYRRNHSSKGRSYPEEYWKMVFDNHQISYEEQYRIGIYQLDFAFPSIKIDLEIDGEQHYVDQRIVDSDKRRTVFLEKQGWKVIRIRWSKFQALENKSEFVEKLLRQLTYE